jgi:uncharacterized protein (DUF169 family)
MIDLRKINEKLNRFVKLIEFPVAVRMLESSNVEKLRLEYPKGKIPRIDLGIKVLPCQAMGMVRKYGWELVLTRDDISCPTGLVTLGFAKMIDSFLSGEDKITPFNQNRKARSRRMRLLPRLRFLQYTGLVLSPIEKAQFEPDLIVIYGNSAQIMRMVQGALFWEGGNLTSVSAGGQGCSQYITYPLISNKCRFILPGNGDRIFGMVGDDQMIFSMPKHKINLTIAGLEESHKGGQRYPIPSYLRYEAQLPSSYKEITEQLLKEQY